MTRTEKTHLAQILKNFTENALLLHFDGPTLNDIYDTVSVAIIGDSYTDTLNVFNYYTSFLRKPLNLKYTRSDTPKRN